MAKVLSFDQFVKQKLNEQMHYSIEEPNYLDDEAIHAIIGFFEIDNTVIDINSLLSKYNHEILTVLEMPDNSSIDKVQMELNSLSKRLGYINFEECIENIKVLPSNLDSEPLGGRSPNRDEIVSTINKLKDEGFLYWDTFNMDGYNAFLISKNNTSIGRLDMDNPIDTILSNVLLNKDSAYYSNK
jgi:hypothetical protein